jgi:hypothetical protein
LSEGGVGFRPDLLRPMGRYRRFAAPSPHPSPRRGEGDDVSRAPSFQDRPGRFSPSPRRGEGARRAGEGAGPKAQQKRGLSPASKRPLDAAFSSPQSGATPHRKLRRGGGGRSGSHLLCGLVLIADPMPSGKEAVAGAAVVLRAIPGHVDATRIRSSAAAAIRTGAPTRLAGVLPRANWTLHLVYSPGHADASLRWGHTYQRHHPGRTRVMPPW